MKTRYCYLVSLIVIASGCATTINQSAITTVASSSESTTQVTINDQLTTDELLSELLLAVEDLSKTMQKLSADKCLNNSRECFLSAM